MSLLASAWDIEAREVRYIPKGAGSYHWVVDVGTNPKWFVAIDDLDTKPWIGESRSETFEGLGAVFEAAWFLENRAGLGFVVGPLERAGGSAIVRFSDQFSMAVFPYVEGNAGTWGEPITEAGRLTLIELLSRLHTAPVSQAAHVNLRGAWDKPADLSESAKPILSMFGPGSFPASQRGTTAGRVSDVSARSVAAAGRF